VIVRPPATWAAVALAAALFALAGLGGAAAADPATTQPATITQGAGEPATTAPATTQPALTASSIPAADSFRAFDVPSDNGTGIYVEWARPKIEPDGLAYVVQVAASEKDLQAGLFKTEEVPSSQGGKGPYRTNISPAELYCPKEPPPLTAEKLRDFATQGVITADQLTRALAVMATMEKEEAAAKPATAPTTSAATQPATAPATGPAPGAAKPPKLSPAEQAERKWFGRLASHLGTILAEKFQADRDEVNSKAYFFRLAVKLGDQTVLVARDGEPVVVEARARANWFKWGKLNNLVLALVFSVIVLTFIEIAKRKPGMFIRKIAGLDAIDEAIGRATEMDRPVMFIHGSGSVGSMSAIASLTILSRIAHRAAQHDTPVHVMNQDPLVTAVSQEVVQQACTEAGRPDAFNPDDVSLVAYDQFSFVAAVSGMMVREPPGAIFLMGYFGAESLLLSETGSSTGAIQVAGTDAYTQLPFFITTCDYTLMGEELYAASAYLSREPRMLGSLRGQDVGKAFIMFVLLVGTIVLTVAAAKGWNWHWLRGLLEASG
jgi:hypothetical protein